MSERQQSRFMLRSEDQAILHPPWLIAAADKSSGGKMKHGFAV